MKKTNLIVLTIALILTSVPSGFATSNINKVDPVRGGVSGGGKIRNELKTAHDLLAMLEYHFPEVEESELKSVMGKFSYDERLEILKVTKTVHISSRRAILIQQLYY